MRCARRACESTHKGPTVINTRAARRGPDCINCRRKRKKEKHGGHAAAQSESKSSQCPKPETPGAPPFNVMAHPGGGTCYFTRAGPREFGGRLVRPAKLNWQSSPLVNARETARVVLLFEGRYVFFYVSSSRWNLSATGNRKALLREKPELLRVSRLLKRSGKIPGATSVAPCTCREARGSMTELLDGKRVLPLRAAERDEQLHVFPGRIVTVSKSMPRDTRVTLYFGMRWSLLLVGGAANEARSRE